MTDDDILLKVADWFARPKPTPMGADAIDGTFNPLVARAFGRFAARTWVRTVSASGIAHFHVIELLPAGEKRAAAVRTAQGSSAQPPT